MVVGAGHGHDLADAEVADARLGHAAPLGGVTNGTNGDNGSLTGHEPRHRRYSPEAADGGGVNYNNGEQLAGLPVTIGRSEMPRCCMGR